MQYLAGESGKLRPIAAARLGRRQSERSFRSRSQADRWEDAVKKIGVTCAVVASLLLVVACGGGGESAPLPTSSPAQGLWTGSTATNRVVNVLVLSDGTYYMLYSSVGNPHIVAGVIQGTSTASAGKFVGSGTEVGGGGEGHVDGQSATVTAEYTAKKSFNGTISYAGGTEPFSSTYDADSESTPSLSALAGRFQGGDVFSFRHQYATLGVSPSGALALWGGRAGECAISGSATPRTDGNAYDFSFTFGEAHCPLSYQNQTFKGIGFLHSNAKWLALFASNFDRSDRVRFLGQKR